MQFHLTLPHVLASICGVIGLALGSLALAHVAPSYESWEVAAALFFGSLSGGTFSLTQPIASRRVGP